MTVKKKTAQRIKKEAYWHRLIDVVGKYKNALFVDNDNVSSKQISKLRKRLREIDAYMIMGKNTLMIAALTHANTKPKEGDADYKKRQDTWAFNPNIELILPQLKGNTNIIFSNGDLGEIKAILDDEARNSPARAGMLAPDDVTIPKGPTGLDPNKTAFFQTLQIQTKIVRTQIEIVSDVHLIFAGEKITSTQADLLNKLEIYPFVYKMKVKKVLQDGTVFDAAFLELNTDTILAKFKAAIAIQAELSLGAGYATTASVPHSIGIGFKNLIAVSTMTGYEFPQAVGILQAAINAPAAENGPVVADAEVPQEVVQKEEEVEDLNMMNLFGDTDDEDW